MMNLMAGCETSRTQIERLGIEIPPLSGPVNNARQGQSSGGHLSPLT